MARLSWKRVLLLTLSTSVVASCGESFGESDSTGGNTTGTSNGGNGTGAGNVTSAGGNGGAGAQGGGGGVPAIPLFEDDIVPILNTTCGAKDNSCHSRVAYAATKDQDCRGWLSLENAAIGSQLYGGDVDGQPTGCPDMPLHDRLVSLYAWEECSGVAKKYVVPCDLEASYLFDKIDDGPYCGGPPSEQMPPGKVMDPKEKETIRAWILAGAPRADGTKLDCGGSGSGGSGGTGGGTGQPPMADLWHPGDMETRPADKPIPFIGKGNDPEDGALTSASLVWTSDLTGQIGTGEQFDAPLSIGTHVITLTATDSNGNTGSESITLFIVAP